MEGDQSPVIAKVQLGALEPAIKAEVDLTVLVMSDFACPLREEILQAGVPKSPYPDYFTRTDMELRRIVDNQWEKELHLRLKLEEKLLELELKEKQKLEEERFKQIMKWRFEKLHKTTKPYELPLKHEDEEELTEASSSSQLSSPQLSQTWTSALLEALPSWKICVTKPSSFL
ncbi:hypothetical protein JD844_008888 [Phrynosoma platyrhinos]|uniref:Uncharacterized protein n=1 Tax=Phrynosoma platyrhinos TaxID=52577 RepID=A0ABQ7TER6_PHRPL|nr:hypothetical protein JD844_008888 [Phrynosoma platyrhinos]